MGKYIRGSLAVITAFSVLGISGCNASDDVVSGTYAIDIEAYDWGCGVAKAIVKLDDNVDGVDKTDFVVKETKQTTDWADEAYPVIETTNERTIINAYSTDADGNKVDGASGYLMIKMKCDPTEGTPLLYTVATNYNTWSDPYYLEIGLADDAIMTIDGKSISSIEIDQEYTTKTTPADVFDLASFTGTDGVSMEYGLYEPEQQTDTLFVWLHGTGEAGLENTDPYVTALANKVTALAGEEFQGIVGPASVLVPQCPTIWQDSDGTGQKWENGLPVIDGPSYYRESLMELIEQTKSEVGATKVVVGGCSGGGYMTMSLILDNPDYFAAAIPICEAYPNDLITADQLDSSKDLPMYFIYSQDDPSVKPEIFEEPLIEKLKSVGASNLHVSAPEHVIDTSGEYDYLNDGETYVYNGHWSWIYFHNNEADCDDCGISVFEWIAQQVK